MMLIEEAKVMIKKHPLIDGEEVTPIRRGIALSVRKLMIQHKDSEQGKRIIKAIVSTSGILCTGVYSAALNYLELQGIKEIKI